MYVADLPPINIITTVVTIGFDPVEHGAYGKGNPENFHKRSPE